MSKQCDIKSGDVFGRLTIIEDRRLGIDIAWDVKTCNNMDDFEGNIDYEYYVAEVEKLLIK